MPEEVTPDTGNTTDATPNQPDWESDENVYRQRYRDAQSHLTPLQQENARLRALEEDPSAYLELGKKQGWIEVDELAEAPGIDPEIAAMRQELAEMRAFKDEVTTQMQAERQSAGMQMFHDDLDTWAEEAGVKLSGADHAAIYGTLIQSPDPTQEQYAKAAFDAHITHKKTEREALEAEIRESLKRPRVPHTPGGGGADTGVPDFSQMSEAEALAWQVERARGIAAR